MFEYCALVAFVSCLTFSGAARPLWTQNTTALGKKERQIVLEFLTIISNKIWTDFDYFISRTTPKYAVVLGEEAIKYVAGDLRDWPSSKRFVTFTYREPSERVVIVQNATQDWKKRPEILQVLKSIDNVGCGFIEFYTKKTFAIGVFTCCLLKGKLGVRRRLNKKENEAKAKAKVKEKEMQREKEEMIKKEKQREKMVARAIARQKLEQKAKDKAKAKKELEEEEKRKAKEKEMERMKEEARAKAKEEEKTKEKERKNKEKEMKKGKGNDKASESGTVKGKENKMAKDGKISRGNA